LATRFDGLIDLDGAIPIPPVGEWQASGLSGRVIEAAYDIAEDRLGLVHIVDADFLRWWMRQPHFHMVK
jgi:hypothetical protein